MVVYQDTDTVPPHDLARGVDALCNGAGGGRQGIIEGGVSATAFEEAVVAAAILVLPDDLVQWLRGCAVNALADREAFAPQDLAALLITLDLVSHSAGRLLFSSGGQLSAVTQDLDVARGICHRSRIRRVASDRLDTTARVKLDR
jgi:hypothetical protein